MLPLLSLSLVGPHLIRIGIERLVCALRGRYSITRERYPALQNNALLFRPGRRRSAPGPENRIPIPIPIPYPLDPKTKFLSLVPTPGEIAPQYQTTVISSDDVAATAALKGSHEQGAPACSS